MRINILVFFILGLNFFARAQDSLATIATMQYQSEPLSDGWEEITSIDGNFRMMMPGQVELKSDTFLTDIGRLNYHVFYHEHFVKEGSPREVTEEDPEKTLLFMLSIYEYPTYTIHSDSLELLDSYFEATIEGATQGVNGTLIYVNDIQKGNYPGKIWRINYNNGKGVIRTKAFLIKKRLYLLSVVSDKAFSANAANDRFFDSFEIFN